MNLSTVATFDAHHLPSIEHPSNISNQTNQTHFSLYPTSTLTDIIHGTELQCLMQEHMDALIYGNTSLYCLTQYDSILCWPRTHFNTIAVLPCLDEFQGIQYDSTQNATRFCQANGTWEKYTNYDACLHLPAPDVFSEFEPIIELPTIIYYIGYTISLISLTLAIVVFAYFKELRCLRNSIHANLFFTYIMSALLWILTLSVQMSWRISLGGCIILVVLFHFFTLTNFFWMLVEGLYLYMLVVKTFSSENIRLYIYVLIGWGGPFVFIVIWTIGKSFTLSYDFHQLELLGCSWMSETDVDWIFQGPICAVLVINLIFLIRIMWVLITKLRSANTVETRQYRKAAKALLVLIPLFGITHLVVLAGPEDFDIISHMFAVVRALLLSTQGFSVSLFYCFLNSEVRNALRHHMANWQDVRNIRLHQSKRYNTKSFSQIHSPKTESTRPLTGSHGHDKRESCVSSTTSTTLVGQQCYVSMPRDSNGALHMLPTTSTTLTAAMPRAKSPLTKDLAENSV